MEILKKGLEFLVNPFFLSLFLLCLCLLFWKKIKSQRLFQLLSAVFFILMLLSTGFLPRYLTYQLESKYSVVQQPNPSIQWIVVLGGDIKCAPNLPVAEQLTTASLKRLIEGVRLIHQLPSAKLILSGGEGECGVTEAKLMAELANSFNIPNDRMILEERSQNTQSQARQLKSLLKGQAFYLVTSAVHMPRTMALCQYYGLNPIPAPTDFTLYWSTKSWLKMLVPNPFNLVYFSIAFHELLGQVWWHGVQAN